MAISFLEHGYILRQINKTYLTLIHKQTILTMYHTTGSTVYVINVSYKII